MIKQITKGFLLITLLLVFQPSTAQDSLELKIGQMLLIGIPQAKVDDQVLEEVRKGKVGSIILFEKNIPAKSSYQELKKINWAYQHAAPIPLFIAIDQEGGKVNRLKEKYGFPRSVTAAKLGKYALDSVRFYAETTAATLAGLGFNVNFAPVVDLATNPTNPIIAKVERSFSANADSVALFAREVIRVHQKLGIVTVLKHFPGHGSSKGDTHLGVEDVTNVWTDQELIPYRRLIDSAFTDAIMTAHIVNKKLDADGLPGTLSKKIVTNLLRETLHYNGVVFSDDMQMHAIAKYYGLETAIKLAIHAGVDILIFSNNIQNSQERTVDKVHSIIRKLVENGTISKERIDQSYRRITELKMKMGNPNEFYRKSLVKAQQEAIRNLEMAKVAEMRAYESEKSAKDQLQKALDEQNKTGKKKKLKRN